MKFYKNEIYHIYNRGNNRQAIFFKPENYLFFLNKIRKHIQPHCSILAWYLMPNHFHLMIHTDEKTIASKHIAGGERNVLVEGIRNTLSSYTQAINKQNRWTGSLFQQNTKAKPMSAIEESYIKACFHYIHQNPLSAKLVKKMEDWEYSSYADYCGKRKGTLINRDKAAELLLLNSDTFYEESYKLITDANTISFWKAKAGEKPFVTLGEPVVTRFGTVTQRVRKGIFKFLRRLGIGFLGLILLFFLLNLIFPLPDDIEYSTIVTDSKGEVVNAYLTSDQKWRMKTELDEISPLLQKTIIAKEDKHFYRHPGVNPFAVARALFNNIFRMRRTSGASTITMQVAKMLEPGKRNIWSKMREVFRATQLELKYSKKEILQMYLNLVPYGGNIEGVKAASLLYFGKNPDHLSLAEITALSIIPNKPGTLVIGRNNDYISIERNRWLKKFADEKVFTAKEIEDALAEPLTAKRGTVPHYIPHLSNKLRKTGGYLIKTNIELNTQLKTEKIVEDYIRSQRLRNIKNAAVIIINNKTHKVITYVGSSNFNDTTDGGQVNGANAVRQPGSTLKPLLYAMCFDEGLLTPKTIMTDVPVNYEGYAPENYDEKFNGYVTVEYALEHSLNIPAVKALRLLGHEKLIQKLSNCNFRQIQKDRRKLGLSLILGGCGTTLEELTGLFSSFACEGIYIAPSLTQSDTSKQRVRVTSPAANYMVNEILSKVNRPDFPLNWTATERMPKIAWKTGTSYGRKDAWSIGYNKNFTVGVWTGNFSGAGVADLSGANVATPLLFKIFNTIDYDSDEEWFTQPSDCDIRTVCSETGLIPSAQCSSLVTDYFIPLISSTKVCDNRQEIMLSPDEKISYCKSCAPSSGYKKKWFKIVEPDMQAWYEENRIVYDKIPSHNPDCELIFKGSAPAITFPLNGTEYIINKKSPEPLQLVCKTANDVTKVYWYINNKFYKSCNAGEKQFFVPEEGPVKISCTDDKGRNRDIRIMVKYVDL